jgi:hypothetical protein
VPILTWGMDATTADLRTAEELDALLDDLDAEARERGRPQDIQLTVEAAGTLGLVVGANWSVLNHIPEDLDPPYLVSVGDHDRDELLDFHVSGDHHSQTLRRNTVPTDAARAAMRHFLATGELSPDVTWEEV